MKYRRLGNSGLLVSNLALGTMIFGEKKERSTSAEDATRIIHPGIPRQNKITINYVQLARKFNNILYFIVFRHQQAMNFQNFLVRFINFSTLKLKTIVKQNIWHGKKGLIKY